MSVKPLCPYFGDTARHVRAWAVEHGDNPLLRIVVAGYDDGRELPDGWFAIERTEHGGYGNASGNANRHRERLWCSPHCIDVRAMPLFGGAA